MLHKNPIPVNKKIRKFNLSDYQLKNKIDELNKKLPDLQGPENKKKRANVYQELVKLKKAQQEPETYIIDKAEEDKKIQERKKRIQKKLDAKKKKLEEKIAAREAARKKAKNAARDRRTKCLYCKKYGHSLHECTERQEKSISANICYNCGSKQHTFKDCPNPKKQGKNAMRYATCFICNEIGHLSKDCPQNENGIYPYGGSCYFCGSKMHKKAECPNKKKGFQKPVASNQNGMQIESDAEDNSQENIHEDLGAEY